MHSERYLDTEYENLKWENTHSSKNSLYHVTKWTKHPWTRKKSKRTYGPLGRWICLETTRPTRNQRVVQADPGLRRRLSLFFGRFCFWDAVQLAATFFLIAIPNVVPPDFRAGGPLLRNGSPPGNQKKRKRTIPNKTKNDVARYGRRLKRVFVFFLFLTTF